MAYNPSTLFPNGMYGGSGRYSTAGMSQGHLNGSFGGYGTPPMQQQGGSPLGNLYRGLQPSTLGNLGQIQRRFGLMGWTPGQNNPWMPQQQPWQLPQGQPVSQGQPNPIHAIGPEVQKKWPLGPLGQSGPNHTAFRLL